MSFNHGIFIGIKSSLSPGGVLALNHINGGNARAATRGLPSTGSVRCAALDIYHPNNSSSRQTYPYVTKFNRQGIGVLPFLYDASVVPVTNGRVSGYIPTACFFSYKIGGPSYSTQTAANLVHFANIYDAGRFPGFNDGGLGNLPGRIGEAIQTARRLGMAINSQAREALCGVAIIPA